VLDDDGHGGDSSSGSGDGTHGRPRNGARRTTAGASGTCKKARTAATDPAQAAPGAGTSKKAKEMVVKKAAQRGRTKKSGGDESPAKPEREDDEAKSKAGMEASLDVTQAGGSGEGEETKLEGGEQSSPYGHPEERDAKKPRTGKGRGSTKAGGVHAAPAPAKRSGKRSASGKGSRTASKATNASSEAESESGGEAKGSNSDASSTNTSGSEGSDDNGPGDDAGGSEANSGVGDASSSNSSADKGEGPSKSAKKPRTGGGAARPNAIATPTIAPPIAGGRTRAVPRAASKGAASSVPPKVEAAAPEHPENRGDSRTSATEVISQESPPAPEERQEEVAASVEATAPGPTEVIPAVADTSGDENNIAVGTSDSEAASDQVPSLPPPASAGANTANASNFGADCNMADPGCSPTNVGADEDGEDSASERGEATAPTMEREVLVPKEGDRRPPDEQAQVHGANDGSMQEKAGDGDAMVKEMVQEGDVRTTDVVMPECAVRREESVPDPSTAPISS